MPHINLHDAVILVSGGSKGLGLAICRRLLAMNARVVTFSRRSTAEVEALAAEQPDRFSFKEGDSSDREWIKKFVRRVEKEIGPIFGLVNNAAVVDETLLSIQDEDAIDRLFEINLKGTLGLTRQAMRGMMIRNNGRIVSISSIVGIRGFKGVAAYAATKGGIEAMTRSLARELGGRGITVNTVAPGYMETDLTKEMNQGQLKQIVRRTPMKRPGTVEDVAGVVAFLFTADAGFVTGQSIVVDGGLTC